MRSYIYLASPYSAHEKSIMDDRLAKAQAATAWLLNNKQWVYSPIVHCHQLVKDHSMPTDAVFWHDYNMAMLKPARELLVLALPGWEQSKGVAAEIAAARAWKKAVRVFTHVPGAGFIREPLVLPEEVTLSAA